MLGRQGSKLRLVEEHFEAFRTLMEGLDHVDLRHIREAKHAVGRRVVEFRPVNDAAFQSGHDFAAGQRDHRRAEFREQISREADSAILQAANLLGALDHVLEPAKRLSRHRPGHEGDDIHLHMFVQQFIVERFAAAIMIPTEQLVGIAEPGGRGAEQRKRLVLAEPIGGHAMAAIKRAGADRIQKLEGANHGAGGEQFKTQAPARHIIHAADEVASEFMEDVALRPGGLEAERGSLRPADIGGGKNSNTRPGGGSRLQKTAPRGRRSVGTGHLLLPLWCPPGRLGHRFTRRDIWMTGG